MQPVSNYPFCMQHMDKIYSDSYTWIHGDLVYIYAFGILRRPTFTMGYLYGVHWHRPSLVW